MYAALHGEEGIRRDLKDPVADVHSLGLTNLHRGPAGRLWIGRHAFGGASTACTHSEGPVDQPLSPTGLFGGQGRTAHPIRVVDGPLGVGVGG
jgi:hypothetical protein